MSTPTSPAPFTYWRNPTAGTLFYTFIGQNGATLTAGQDTKTVGDPWTFCVRNTLKLRALNYALENGLIEILKTPIKVSFDAVANDVKIITVSGGAAAVADPDYGSYSGIPPHPDLTI